MAKSVNLDVSQRVDVTCRRGDTFVLNMNITDSNGDAVPFAVTDSFKMEVRRYDTADTAYADGDDNIILSTEDDSSGSKYISWDAGETDGSLTFTVSSANMKQVPSGMFVYDVEATVNGAVTTWMHGIFKVNEDVTV